MASKKNKFSKKVKTPVKKTAGENHLTWVLIALVITFIAFFPSLSNDFVNWDDDVNLLDNKNLEAFDWPHIKAIFSTTVMGGYNPLSIFSLALEKHFFGLNPKVFHTTNLLLHLACVFLVFKILLAMNLNPMAAFLGALLFGIHPMRVESVAWVTERKDVLFGVFYLAAMYTYILSLRLRAKAKDPAVASRIKRLTAYTLVFFLLSLFSKIQAVAFPLSLLAIDYFFKRKLSWKLVFEKTPFFLLSLIVGLLGIYFLSEAKTLDSSTYFNFLQRLLIGSYSFCIYLLKFGFPYEMSPLYPYPSKIPWEMYLGIPGVLAAIYWFYHAFKNDRKAEVFGLAFFAFNIFFVLQILGAGQGYKADRFTYIPYLGLIFIVAWMYQEISRKYPSYQRYLQMGLGAWLLVFAQMTWKQCGVWKNGETLWSHVIKHYDNTALPFGNLGHYYRDQKDYKKALENYDMAVRLNTREGKTFNSRGKTYFDMGNPQKALEDYTRAIEMDADMAEFYVNRGAAYGMLGKVNEALRDFNEGVRLDPDWANGYLNRSLVFTQTGQYQKALDDINSYLRLNPGRADMWYEKSMTLRRIGKDQEALAPLNRAIQLDGDRGLFWLERAKLNYSLGNTTQRKQDAQRAQQLGVEVDPALLQ